MSIIQQKIASGNLKAWYDFRNGTVDDLSGNGNDVVTITGSPQFSREGLEFDGDADSLTTADVDIAQDITIFALIKPTQFNHTGGSDFERVVEKRDSYDLSINSSGRATIILSGLSDGTLSTTDDLTLNEWQVIIFSYNSSAGTHTSYLNGLQNSQETSITGSLTQSNYAVVIGDRNAGARNYKGNVGAIGIMNTAITATEAAQLTGELLAQKFPTKPRSKTVATSLINLAESPLAAWDMKLLGNTVPDITGAGNDGAVVGSPTAVKGILGDGINTTNGYLNCGSGLNSNDNMFVSMWVKTGSNITADGAIFCRDFGGNDRWAMRIANSTLHLYDDIDNAGTIRYVTTIQPNSTYHIVCGLGPSETNYMWINTVAAANNETSADGFASYAGVTGIGSLPITDPGAKFEGEIYSVEILGTTVPSAAKIQKLYDRGNKLVQYKTDWAVNVSASNET